MGRHERPSSVGACLARSMPEDLRNLLAGRSADGEALGLQVQPGRRPGYDLTFSAPKGVSLLWAFGATRRP